MGSYQRKMHGPSCRMRRSEHSCWGSVKRTSLTLMTRTRQSTTTAT